MKKLIQIIIYFVILSLVACSSNKTEMIEVKNESGKIIETFAINKENGKKNGVRKQFSEENGALVLEENYKEDILEGKRTFFFENEQPQEIENYENGKLVGQVLSYYKDGKLLMKTPYILKNGESTLEGVLEKFYPNGQLKEKVNLINNAYNGSFEEYHEHGQLIVKGNYKEDRFGDEIEVGIIEFFDSTGVLIRKLDCQFDEESQIGRCKTIWKNNNE